MQLKVQCPKCRKIETINMNDQMLREIYSVGYASISFYHNNHVLYVGLDKYGIKTIDTFDPPSTFVFSSNLVVDDVFILRNPIIHLPINLLFYDIERKILDARFVNDHLHAIIFARYFRHLEHDNGFITALGIKYYVRRNSHIVIASVPNHSDNSQGIDNQRVVDQLLESIKAIPPDLKNVLSTIEKNFN